MAKSKQEKDLAAKIAQVKNEIRRRGGPKKAPGFAKQLAALEAQLKQIQNPPNPPPTGGNDTVKPTDPPSDSGGNQGNSGQQPDQPGNDANPDQGQSDDSTITNPVNPGNVANEDDRTALERVKALLAEGESFGRRLANEFYATGSLGRMDVKLTDDEVAAMAAAKQQLQMFRDPTALELEALNASRQGLMGFDAPEMAAMRSQAREMIGRETQGAMRQLAKQQANRQVFGSAALAQQNLLRQGGVRETRNLERDLLVKNIEAKRMAREQFGNLTSQVEGARAARTANATSQLGALSTSQGDTLRKLGEFNLNQAAAEKAGQIGSIFGGIGTITGQTGLLRGENMANQQYLDSQEFQDKMLDLIRRAMREQNNALGG